ncbi:L,D-transpeptidase [Streptomyces huiliensis]|uniref:L,D-transpeptidase n=1 Tax=Streptomyces huiliensis TaxID=2876027 RepID=UPI001CBE9727|nr:Ig-like domain-containing protein [Streptomyces huiliensis]MBZ4321902.1 L,D-transpeptidase family protein [Streptomyces huiliensis]
MNVLPLSARFGRAGSRGRRGALSAVVLAAVMTVATACGGDGDGADPGKKAGKKVAEGPSQAVVSIAVKDRATEVRTSGALKVTAENGSLTSVKVTDDKGGRIEGKISRGGSLWEPVAHLAASTKYAVDAVAKDKEGRESAKHASFTTLTPKNTFAGYFTPEDGSTVGVGMPVSLTFSRGITDPKAVEKAVKVTAEPGVEIKPHWFGNDRVDFRPEKYWAAGTKVTLQLNLNGVEGRPGVYGTQTKTVKFTVGRRQVSTVDARAHTMKVERDGKVIKTVPISAGAPANPTYNGQMVISEKYEVTRMNGDTVGFGGEYDIKDVPHAMRLSTSGTFIHGNYWSGSDTFGSANASHGCVGLEDQRGGGDPSMPGAWFFKNSMIGDVVVVKNSDDKTIAPENGLNGWNMPWSEWTKSS